MSCYGLITDAELFSQLLLGQGLAFPQGADGGKGAVVDDGLMVVFNNNVFQLIPLNILTVDFGTGVLALPERADVKIIVQNTLQSFFAVRRDSSPSASLRSCSDIRGVGTPVSVRWLAIFLYPQPSR